jgi:hypothetical protein
MCAVANAASSSRGTYRRGIRSTTECSNFSLDLGVKAIERMSVGQIVALYEKARQTRLDFDAVEK